VNVRVENNGIPFTSSCSKGEVLRIPIAHNEGNFYADTATVDELERSGRVILRYCDDAGNVNPESNPNGAINNIAGVCNEGGNVLGMMPHPERCSEKVLGSADGIRIFESAIKSWGVR
jgi:phosphoribosylformylglycinamidine synthase